MRKIGGLYKVSIFLLLIAISTLIGCGKYNNKKDADDINRIIQEDDISPQIIPESFESTTLSKDAENRFKKNFRVETVYDCAYESNGTEYNIPLLTSYANSIIVFMKAKNTGWDLKKGTDFSVSFCIEEETGDNKLQGGIICNQDYEDPQPFVTVEQNGKTFYSLNIEIESDGLYYPYLLNESKTSRIVKEYNPKQ